MHIVYIYCIIYIFSMIAIIDLIMRFIVCTFLIEYISYINSPRGLYLDAANIYTLQMKIVVMNYICICKYASG